jgi:TRAP-type C4-dicarboxylate transport system permease small subunit
VLMVYLGVIFSHEAWTDPTPVLRLPYTVVYGPVTLGFALMLARHLEFLWRHR